MASIVGKKRSGATYYYLVESARVGGKPRITSQEYLGTAEELAAAMRGGGLGLPDRIQHKDFGAVAAAWGVLEDLGVVQVIDEVAGARRADARAIPDLPGAGGAEPGGRAALEAGLRGLVGEDGGAPVDEHPPAVLDTARFWDAVTPSPWRSAETSRGIALAIVASFRLDCSLVVLDMTNLSTSSTPATAGRRSPSAARPKEERF